MHAQLRKRPRKGANASKEFPGAKGTREHYETLWNAHVKRLDQLLGRRQLLAALPLGAVALSVSQHERINSVFNSDEQLMLRIVLIFAAVAFVWGVIPLYSSNSILPVGVWKIWRPVQLLNSVFKAIRPNAGTDALIPSTQSERREKGVKGVVTHIFRHVPPPTPGMAPVESLRHATPGMLFGRELREDLVGRSSDYVDAVRAEFLSAGLDWRMIENDIIRYRLNFAAILFLVGWLALSLVLVLAPPT